jgi:hypothetical protein
MDDKPDEIEVTPEMIEAGYQELMYHPIMDPDEESMKIAVREVFVAMTRRTYRVRYITKEARMES